MQTNKQTNKQTEPAMFIMNAQKYACNFTKRHHTKAKRLNKHITKFLLQMKTIPLPMSQEIQPTVQKMQGTHKREKMLWNLFFLLQNKALASYIVIRNIRLTLSHIVISLYIHIQRYVKHFVISSHVVVMICCAVLLGS